VLQSGLRPGIRLAFDSPLKGEGYREVFPFRKPWMFMLVLLAFDIAFLLPAIYTADQVLDAWTRMDGLFDLVIAVFLSAWLLGWSMAPLVMTSILLVLLFGREVVRAWRDESGGMVETFIGLPLIGIAVRYEASVMRNLRRVEPVGKSGTSWRGPHLAFDYGAHNSEFGSNLSTEDAARVKAEIELATGTVIRHGEARPEEMTIAQRPEPRGRLAALKRAARARVPEPVIAESVTAGPSAPTAVEPITLASPSTLVLIFANLVPVFGALAWGWDLSTVMVLYWAESAVIGLFNVLKIILVGGWGSVLAVPFFLGHFGGFMAVHFLFIYTLFVKGPEDSASSQGLAEVAGLFASLWPALLMLFLSHAYSFYRNFLGRGEFRGRQVKDQMSEPYSRIIFMHLVLIIGGGLSLFLGGPTPVLIGVIALKILFDVRAHLREHEA
jgi:hypothetical protein